MRAWLSRWRAHREARAVQRRAIPDALWNLTLANLPFIERRSQQDLAELRRLASLFLDQKEFSGGGGLVVDDRIALSIAVQACLPVLRFGLSPYTGFVGIVVHPDEVVARREVADDDGVVHAYEEVLVGEAMEGGPIMLSWHDVDLAGAAADWSYNVVIHEFAHVLDMLDGNADGVPPLPSAVEREAWMAVIEADYERFCDRVDRGEHTVLDPYGAEGVDEYFAVAAEAFFVNANAMRAEHPELYEMLARYFRQDPAAFGG
jgi:Mlc titration factor MtfA (ptsG expression regulator)